MIMITLLDYGAGNVRSVVNAIEKLGENVRIASAVRDIETAEKLIFPGVGNFDNMMRILDAKGYIGPLKTYLNAQKPFLGICLGMHALFDGSEEAPDLPGLGIIPGRVKRFAVDRPVPHMGWNGLLVRRPSRLLQEVHGGERFYFVHSYFAVPNDPEAVLTETDYGQRFVSGVQHGNLTAVQFHPEKSGRAGHRILENFIRFPEPGPPPAPPAKTELAKRIIACLDVRMDDHGELVVTKGDQYDVREKGSVRNLGRPVDLARRYYEEGADEITFLNITGYRDYPLADMPMLRVLQQASRNVFVPLTIGGGIRGYRDKNGDSHSALEVAAAYFRAGADKISIGSDAVAIAENFLQTGVATGNSAIEQISRVYGNQAVVVSADPRRVYTASAEKGGHHVIPTRFPGPRGERYCWYQCTVKGGRENRNLDAVTLCRICERLGAGEILLNCIDRDGTNAGFDLELINAVTAAVSIPVIASSGAGNVDHFMEVFTETRAEAALAAGIFHRREVPIAAVKDHLKNKVAVRA